MERLTERALEFIGLKKKVPILTETTLTDDDLVYLGKDFGNLYLIRGDYIYLIKEDSSEINPSNPIVSLEFLFDSGKNFEACFKPYKKIRGSL